MTLFIHGLESTVNTYKLPSIRFETIMITRTCFRIEEPLLYVNDKSRGRKAWGRSRARRNKFCSQSCGAVLNNTLHPKKRKGTSERKKRLGIRSPRAVRICTNCGIEYNGYTTKYCSQQCRIEDRNAKFLKAFDSGQLKDSNKRPIKSHLIKLYGNKCLDPECKWDHAARPITVELEHKDGNAENNRLENLTLLCPNCHSLTPTYKNKNAGKGRAFRRQRYAEGKSY
jgi:hypothetical protein